MDKAIHYLTTTVDLDGNLVEHMTEVATKLVARYVELDIAEAEVLALETADTALSRAEAEVKRLEEELAAAKAMAQEARKNLTQERPEVYVNRAALLVSVGLLEKDLATYATAGRLRGRWEAKVHIGQIPTPDGAKDFYLSTRRSQVEVTDPAAIIRTVPNWEVMFDAKLTLKHRGITNDFALLLMEYGKVEGLAMKPDALVVEKDKAWRGKPLLEWGKKDE